MNHCLVDFYIDESDVDNNRNRDTFFTIKGTQKLHSIASVNTEGKVNNRHAIV